MKGFVTFSKHSGQVRSSSFRCSSRELANVKTFIAPSHHKVRNNSSNQKCGYPCSNPNCKAVLDSTFLHHNHERRYAGDEECYRNQSHGNLHRTQCELIQSCSAEISPNDPHDKGG